MSSVFNDLPADSAPGLTLRRGEQTGLSRDATNLSIAMGQYHHAAEPLLISALLNQANQRKAAGDYAGALRCLDGLSSGQPSPMQLQALMLRAELLSLMGEFRQARRVYQDLREMAAVHAGLTPTERQRLIGLIHLNLAWLEEQQGQPEAAVTAYTAAIDALTPLAEIDPALTLPSLMTAYRQRSHVQRGLGQIEAALADLDASARFQTSYLQPVHTQLEQVGSWFSLGLMQQELANWQEAFDTFALALRLAEGLEPAEHGRWNGMILTQQARCQAELGRVREAATLYGRAGTFLQADTAPRQWVQLQLLAAGLALRNGQTGSLIALSRVDQVLERLEAEGVERQELAVPLVALAELCCDTEPVKAQGYFTAAIRSLEQSARSLNENGQRLLVEAYRGRGGLLEAEGQLTKALASFKQALRQTDGLADSLLQAELALRIGLIQQALGKSAQALEAFARARQAAPPADTAESPGFRAGYFEAFVLAGEPEGSERALALLLALDQRVPGELDYDLACLLTRLGRYDEAFVRLASHLGGPHPLPLEDIRADADLLALQADPRWEPLIRA